MNFDAQVWAAVPFHFWSATFFVLGAIVGSFLNVCVHRMPRGESLITPPSHCPHCEYRIPGYLNIPIVTWLVLRGRCANCRDPISPRYVLLETLTGALFMSCWLQFGHESVLLALVHCLFLSGLIVATFIDFEHFIIPDEITFGGIVAGALLSVLIPSLHGVEVRSESLKQSLLGIGFGAGVIYAILRLGKLMFGKKRIDIESGELIRFKETVLELPGKEIPYEDIFSRKSDVIRLQADRVRLILKDLSGPLEEQVFEKTELRLSPDELIIDEKSFNPEEVDTLEAESAQIELPQEAMGLGDVKFMGGIGAFVGWQGVVFALMGSAILGSLVGVFLIATKKHEWSSRLPYGPYIALAALVWVFFEQPILKAFNWWIYNPTLPAL